MLRVIFFRSKKLVLFYNSKRRCAIKNLFWRAAVLDSSDRVPAEKFLIQVRGFREDIFREPENLLLGDWTFPAN